MNTIKTMLRSRTFWTVLALFVFGGLQEIQPMVSGGQQALVELLLSILAIYFKLNPSQDYASNNSTTSTEQVLGR